MSFFNSHKQNPKHTTTWLCGAVFYYTVSLLLIVQVASVFQLDSDISNSLVMAAQQHHNNDNGNNHHHNNGNGNNNHNNNNHHHHHHHGGGGDNGNHHGHNGHGHDHGNQGDCGEKNAQYPCRQEDLDRVQFILDAYYDGLSSNDFTPLFPYFADDIVFHYVDELIWRGKEAVQTVFENANLNFNYYMPTVYERHDIVNCDSGFFRINRTLASLRSKREADNYYNFYVQLNREGKIAFMEESSASVSLRYVLEYFFDDYNTFCNTYMTFCRGDNNHYGSMDACVNYNSQLPFKKLPITILNFYGDSLLCRNIAVTPATIFQNEPGMEPLVDGACLAAGPSNVSPMCA
jgi:ketosteroid isomerase-like protein